MVVVIQDLPAAPVTLTERAKSALEGSVGRSFTVPAGESLVRWGVEFDCTSNYDCTVTISAASDGEVMASMTTRKSTADDSTPMVVAMALDKQGWPAFKDLDRVLTVLTNGSAMQREELASNEFHVDNGSSGVTSSFTSHCVAGGCEETNPGISDIRVTVTPDIEDDPNSRDRTVNKIGEAPIDPNPGTDPWVIMDPVVLADEDTGAITGNDGTANFEVDASWASSTAQVWNIEHKDEAPAGMLTGNMWRYVFEAPMDGSKDLPGGRTVHVDLRSDYDPNNMVLNTMNDGTGGPTNHPNTADAVPDPAGNPNGTLSWPRGGAGTRIASGPTDSADTEVRIPWFNDDEEPNITFDNVMQYPAFGQEINLMRDNPHTQRTVEGADGSYMGVRGRFVCEDANDDGICRINSHGDRNVMGSEMAVSMGDFVRFVPYVYSEDMDWLAAGVWLTIPDDEDGGNYAIGAFAWGSAPWEPVDEADARGLTGDATYTGQAFGRYAEMQDQHHMGTGRFEATASLTADFDAGGGAPDQGDGNQTPWPANTNDFGSIQGSVTKFMTYGDDRSNQQEQNWSLTLQPATIMMGEDNNAIVDGSALRFHNGGLSGHADRGYALDGYWNGQFYNVREKTDGAQSWDIPGSVAGTFGATTERPGDTNDDYALTLIGAFGAHEGGMQPDSNARFVTNGSGTTHPDPGVVPTP